LQFYIDGKKEPSNPPRIPTDKVREFEIYANNLKAEEHKILKGVKVN